MPASVRPGVVLGAVGKSLAESLAAQNDVEHLESIAGSLPACAHAVGCEVRLTDHGPVDLGVSVSQSRGGSHVLAGRTGDPCLEHAAVHDERWRRLRTFARDWTRPASPLLVRLPFIFLEFDAGGKLDGPSIPSVFLGLDWPSDELNGDGPYPAQEGLRTLLDAAERLRAERFDREVLAVAHEALAALPVGAVLLHVGVMLSRPGENLRLSVIVPRAHVASYLETVGRGPCTRAVGAAIERYARVGGFVHPGSPVQLDFDAGGTDARLGMTLCAPRDELWPPLLAALCHDGLCQREKAVGLLQWPGESLAQFDAEVPAWRVRRAIEHVKLVFAPELVGAKAYLGAMPECT